ncbi:T-complex protein 1 subunit gamma [Operophtera brumata]|uniref:T-complex protein 1 subunit gamma n=1 Tax=Operophtera brumata TaxID=104452 RepID=A0A0L7L527_OPEBR|nr:T-complex protein 1 subunit gamma [Operophtera brumata]
MFSQQPILVLSQNTKRESGRKVQLDNINAGKTIADIIRTCLGPQAMLKMLMDPMGGIVMTNDGNAILREITVQHPAAKFMIEIARTQDEEVGDGTTSVIVLAGEILAVAEPFLAQNIHPTVIIREYRQALEDAVKLLQDKISVPIDLNDKEKLKEVIRSCVGTKYIGRWADLAVDISLDAVNTVTINDNGRVEVDIKNYAKIEKIPGGTIEESKVLNGVMINKDVTHPKMRRYIENPRIVLLDCNLEYKQGESQTNVEILGDQLTMSHSLYNLEYKQGESQTNVEILGDQLEEEHVQRQCEEIIAVKPDIVFTEKGVSDLAQHYLLKAGITAIRSNHYLYQINPTHEIIFRLRKTDNNRLARACGATIVNRTEELKEADVGTGAGRFEIKKIGDEYFTFALTANAAHNTPYRAVAQALEIIPRTLAQNCGANTIRTLTALRAKHAAGLTSFGIDGESGAIVDMAAKGIWEPLAVKLQVYKTAIETAILLLRIDDIVSGSKKRGDNEPAGPGAMAAME